MKHLYKLLLFVTVILTITCERRHLDDECLNTEVSIPVLIDWSQSGIFPESGRNVDYVHRVSLRFFPLDGSPAFDRYLEGNIFDGEIKIPVGRYSVVAYNEAIDDLYWQDNLSFSGVDNYADFAANIVTLSSSPFEFYTPDPDEKIVTEPFKLASWSLNFFEVTPQMLNCTTCRENPNDMINSLTKIIMRPLVVPVKVVVEVTNLKSAMRMEAALSGMAVKVYMASGITHTQPSTHLFAFSSPIWNDTEQTHGWVERSFMAFGRLPQLSQYTLDLNVILVSGELYVPDQALHYDVTNQVISALENSIEVRVELILPEVDGGIHLGDWDDEVIIIK